MLTGMWPPSPGEKEYALGFDCQRTRRILVIPALFDEATKLRHFTVEVMRRLDTMGIDSMLPDLPGTNESATPLEKQTLTGWQAAMHAAAKHFRATHVLAIRGGALLADLGMPTILYAPVPGSGQLRAMLRAQVIADSEAARGTTRDALLESGRKNGLRLAGYCLGPAMIAELEDAQPPQDGAATTIPQSELGGGGLWLRAEAGHDPAQADVLANRIAEQLA